MGRWIDDYNDLEKKLETIANSIYEANDKFNDIEYDKLDMYTWKYGCYEDVAYDFSEKLNTIRENIINLIDEYNYSIERYRDDLDSTFTYGLEKKRINVEEVKE